jgi:hypothetical protein
MKALREYDGFVVQTEEMAGALSRRVNVPIWVVANRPADLFRSTSMWSPVELPPRLAGESRLFYPARGYPHKNHKFIPIVCAEFARRTGRSLRVVTTLTVEEVKRLFGAEPECLLNVGEVTVAQCATLYSKTDGLFFPSLNETSSSAPLEAMAMGRPVVASDLDFAVSATEGNGFHYRVHDAAQAAAMIELATSGVPTAQRAIARARKSIESRGTAYAQAMEYLTVIDRMVANEDNV